MTAASAEHGRGRATLIVGHCAGMVDLVALPVWIGVLVGLYGFDPQRSGGLLTLFLLGVVASSVAFAGRFNRLAPRVAAVSGFVAASVAFLLLARVNAYGFMAALHALAGLSVGCALSAVHGSVGASARPHRLFAIASIGLGVFGVLFMATVPKLITGFGGPALFTVLAGVMLVAAAASAAFFPAPAGTERSARTTGGLPRLDKRVWFGIAGICCMTLIQAMTFAFAERAGIDRGFSKEGVAAVLIAMGLFALVPGALAAALERRWSVRAVTLCAPLAQAALCAVIANSGAFPAYAVAFVLFPTVIIFTHPFAFGLLARLDPTSRAVSATPAMVMTGAACGPILGGTLIKVFGYGSLALAAGVVAALAVLCFWRASAAGATAAPQAAASNA